MNKQKILIITTYELITDNGKRKLTVLDETIKYMYKRNYDIHLYSSSPFPYKKYNIPIKVYIDNNFYKVKMILSRLILKKKTTMVNNNKYKNIEFNQKLPISPLNFIKELSLLVIYTSYFLFKIIGIINNLKPDIVYAIDPIPSFIVGLIRKKRKIFFVRRIYGNILGVLMKDNKREFKLFLKHPSYYLGLKIYSDCNIITNDGTNCGKLMQFLKHDINRMLFIMNGVNKKTSKENKYESNKIRFISVTRLVQWKRLDRNIRFIKELTKYSKNIEYTIVGTGPEYISLKNLVKELKLENYITFVGARDREEVYTLIAKSDIVLSFYDLSNLTNQVLEGIANNKIVISLNDFSLKDLIIDEENGILIDITQLEKEAKRVWDILNDNKKVKIMKMNIAKTKNNLLTWEQRINKEIEFINKVRNLT